MNKKGIKRKRVHTFTSNSVPVNPVGYPASPAGEDVYDKDKEMKDIDPEDITKKKAPVEKTIVGKNNEKGFDEDQTAEDLDIPGSEEDEKEVNTGSEDEENNYYSLGGDGNNKLDEE
ncbi:MAG TPA: hypothetical protein VNZ45_15695 [Bacteroidia bacterium]|jgi:hypothetical protein|nr:hypothetical protein [Bacteroidia bacterium]